jgi:hypothetical protein
MNRAMYWKWMNCDHLCRKRLIKVGFGLRCAAERVKLSRGQWVIEVRRRASIYGIVGSG